MPRPLRTLLLLCATLVACCSAIGGSFKAGMWTGILAIAVIAAVVAWPGCSRVSRGRGSVAG